MYINIAVLHLTKVWVLGIMVLILSTLLVAIFMVTATDDKYKIQVILMHGSTGPWHD